MESRLSQIQLALEFMSEKPHLDYVYWAELTGKRSEPSLHAAPIDVADVLRQGVYRHLKAVVLTSATLAIDKSFGYIRRRLGLDEIDIAQDHCLGQPPIEELIASPFDYREQVLLCVPTDVGEPRHGRYGDDLADYIKDVSWLPPGELLSYLLLTGCSGGLPVLPSVFGRGGIGPSVRVRLPEPASRTISQ